MSIRVGVHEDEGENMIAVVITGGNGGSARVQLLTAREARDFAVYLLERANVIDPVN